VERGGSVITFALHPDGKHVAVVSQDFLWWQALDGAARPKVIAPLHVQHHYLNRSGVPHLTFKDNGTTLEFKGLFREGAKKPGQYLAITWRVDPANRDMPCKEVGRRNLTADEINPPVTKRGKSWTVTSPDGTQRAVATATGQVEIRDARTGQVLKQWQAVE
jgi:hypothetical protein